MKIDEALWWDAQLKLETWPERTDAATGRLLPAGMPADVDPRRVVRSLVDARQVELDHTSAALGKLDGAIDKAERHLQDLKDARDRQVAEANAKIADLERCTEVRDLVLATFDTEPTTMGTSAHDATIQTGE